MNYKNLANDISSWLKNYLESNDLLSFVVGVSGGIDSAVTSELCAQTGIHTYVLNIPIKSKDKNSELSDLQCKYLTKKYPNVTYLKIEGSQIFKAFMDSVDTSNDIDILAAANSKSRLRMVVLYYIAGKNKGIVVGTGNKVEDFGVGFYTKYGDGGVDISPIADLTKSEVREIAKILGTNINILQAPPTDGLWEDDRTDEDQIGASYEELEWAMANININMETATKREREIINIYKKFHTQNAHKMKEIPIYKKIY